MLAITIALSFALASSALPTHVPHDSFTSTTLLHRTVATKKDRTSTWAHNQAAGLRNKYHVGTPVERRQAQPAVGSNTLVNINADSTYYGTLLVGTPPQPFNLILDTGSSDMWVAGTNCPRCSSVPRFDETISSTFLPSEESFSIQYGSGSAGGVMASDVVQMAGFEVPNQDFAVVTRVSAGLLDNDISGILGLGFGTIASSGSVPFAQTLAEQNVLKQPLFSFFLTRFLDVLRTGDQIAQHGGEFMLGGTNPSLFTGEIDFVDIPRGREGFWGLEMTTLIVNGNEVPVPASESFAAIDTGTTLVGGPAKLIAAIYSQIPGAVRGSGDYEGFWLYPCGQPIVISLAFGPRGQHKRWTIDPRDMELMRQSPETCVGSFFEIDLGTNPENPAWIVGDTFLKNVYNVYRFDPPSVGFAQLSQTALQFNGVRDQELPSPTSVANPVRATASAPGGGRLNTDRNSRNASSRTMVSALTMLVTAIGCGLATM